MEKTKKIIITLIMMIMMIMMIAMITEPYKVYATTIDVNAYKPNIEGVDSANRATTIENSITNILAVIGTVVSVAMLIVLRIKYMIGTVQEKADYKKTMGPYLVGAVMVFSITQILKIIASMVSEVG